MTTMKQARLAIGTAALLLFAAATPSGPAAAQQDYVSPPGVTIMSEDEIRSAIIGNTLAGVSRGTDWAEFYSPGGSIRGLWGRTPKHLYGGSWSIKGPTFCLEYPTPEDSGCYTLSREEDTVFLFNLDGSRGKYPQAEIKGGNPEGL